MRSVLKNKSKDNSLWLLTCSDLFFILFAFFVLNHGLIAENKNTKFKTEKMAETNIKASVLTSFNYNAENLNSDYLRRDMSYSLGGKWFLNDNTLTSFGEMQLDLINKISKEHSGLPEILIINSDQSNVNKLMARVHLVRSLLLQNGIRAIPVKLTSGVSLEDARIDLIVRF